MSAILKKVLFGRRSAWMSNLASKLDGSKYEWTFGDFLQEDFTEYDLLVPLKIEDYWGLNENRAAAKGRALFPTPEVVDLCHDKHKFNTFVGQSELGWLVPPMYTSDQVEFPFIIKRRIDEFGAHSYLVREAEALRSLSEVFGHGEYFNQAFVPGNKEYATHLLVKNGMIMYSANVVYEMGGSYYVKSANQLQKSIMIKNYCDDLFIFSDLLALIGFKDGTCCINFKYQRGRPALFEINPRFGGSLFLDINRYLEAYLAAVAT